MLAKNYRTKVITALFYKSLKGLFLLEKLEGRINDNPSRLLCRCYDSRKRKEAVGLSDGERERKMGSCGSCVVYISIPCNIGSLQIEKVLLLGGRTTLVYVYKSNIRRKFAILDE